MNIIRKTYRFIAFIPYYFLKLLQANIYIAYDIITPKMRSNPGLVWIPIRLNTKFGLFLFSNLLSMTPGTLSVDFSEQKNALLVHYLYNSKDNIVTEIEKLQNKIIEILN